MKDLIELILNFVAPLAIGWLWYLQKRTDSLHDKLAASDSTHVQNINKAREDYETKLLAIEQKHYDKLISLERDFNHKLVETVQRFTDMHYNAGSQYVKSQDFNAWVAGLDKKLDKLEELIQKKADK